jgi:hypothetical protein
VIDVELVLELNALAVEVVLHGDWQAHVRQLRSMCDYGPEYGQAADRLERVAANRAAVDARQEQAA